MRSNKSKTTPGKNRRKKTSRFFLATSVSSCTTLLSDIAHQRAIDCSSFPTTTKTTTTTDKLRPTTAVTVYPPPMPTLEHRCRQKPVETSGPRCKLSSTYSTIWTTPAPKATCCCLYHPVVRHRRPLPSHKCTKLQAPSSIHNAWCHGQGWLAGCTAAALRCRCHHPACKQSVIKTKNFRHRYGPRPLVLCLDPALPNLTMGKKLHNLKSHHQKRKRRSCSVSLRPTDQHVVV